MQKCTFIGEQTDGHVLSHASSSAFMSARLRTSLTTEDNVSPYHYEELSYNLASLRRLATAESWYFIFNRILDLFEESKFRYCTRPLKPTILYDGFRFGIHFFIFWISSCVEIRDSAPFDSLN